MQSALSSFRSVTAIFVFAITACFVTHDLQAAEASEALPIRTPPPGTVPQINGPLVYGCRPNRPLLYRIPCTGSRPIRFAVENLPSSLHLDSDTGIIRGTAPQERGEYQVTLHGAVNREHRSVV